MLRTSALEATFDETEPLTIGLEEEVFLLDPDTLALAPVAVAVLERMGGDERAKLELPAAQVELLTRPHVHVGEAIAELTGARAALAAAADGLAIPAALAVHPFAPAEGELNSGQRYEAIEREFGWVARRQIVGAFQVHVAVGGAERTLAVYNALRAHLPEIAALAAAAPYYEGRDTGLASVRPALCTMLPRQGAPPGIPSWEAFTEALNAIGDPRQWWYELRPHMAFGTLELRVPDTQPELDATAAIAAYTHALIAWLSERHDAGEPLSSHATWRIEENRWSAARFGVEGRMADLDAREPLATRDVIRARLAELAPYAQRLGCAAELAGVERLVERNAAIALRDAGDARAAAKWSAQRFLTPATG